MGLFFSLIHLLLEGTTIIQQVDVERLYKHILRLEGVRHPVKTPKKFNRDADYIKSEFVKYGLQTSEQKFLLENYDFEFRNIEGTIGDIEKPTILITSHYDTMGITPGADDNASGIAVMLEAARVIAESNKNYNIPIDKRPKRVIPKSRKDEKNYGI